MTVALYMTWETPYLPAVAGLTVEAWPASDFAHSPVGNPSAYPPAPSPTATTTTDSSGDCELTGLTAATDYYISIIDQNNQPWFQFCPGGYLGNSSGTRRRWSINQGPVPPAAVPPLALVIGWVKKFYQGAKFGSAAGWGSAPATPYQFNLSYGSPVTGAVMYVSFTLPAGDVESELYIEVSDNAGSTWHRVWEWALDNSAGSVDAVVTAIIVCPQDPTGGYIAGRWQWGADHATVRAISASQ